MRVSLIAIGRRMPDWVAAGVDEYSRRFSRDICFELRALHVPASPSESAAIVQLREGEALRAAIPDGARVIALDERGRSLTSAGWAERLGRDRDEGIDWALLVGGADGHDEATRARADWCWSLSMLTLPHMLVRVVVAEQVYRAVSILQGHPYHREG
ncbi:MAG: 23S rRNA (pseudouridine(1915)-N(3))-methyltransferase RlmH [Thioalkalivibrionaceae bacterium]